MCEFVLKPKLSWSSPARLEELVDAGFSEQKAEGAPRANGSNGVTVARTRGNRECSTLRCSTVQHTAVYIVMAQGLYTKART